MKLCLNDRFPSEMEIELSLLQFYLLKLTTPAHEEAEGNCFSFQDVGRNPSRVWAWVGETSDLLLNLWDLMEIRAGGACSAHGGYCAPQV